jgi:hypothetical protein
MAKLSKKSLAEFDAALDQLGGGAPPVPPPSKRPRPIARPRKGVKAKARTKKR